MSHRQPKSQTPQSTELGWWRAWTWREALPGVSDTPSLGTWGCGEHEGTPFLSGAGCLGGECSFIVQFVFFSPGGQEKALWGGVMVLFSARRRGR